MAFFIFQHSGRLLIDYLQSVVENISQAQAEDPGRADQESQAEARKLDYLRKAVEAGETHTMETEYWSDVRALTEGKDMPLLGNRNAVSGPGKAAQYDGPGVDGFAGDIQGIPEEANIGVYEGLVSLYERH